MSFVSPLSPIPSISVDLVASEPLGLDMQPWDVDNMDEGPRPRHLLPPPVCRPLRFGGSGHTKELPADKKGLMKGKVDELLRVSRERNMASSKKSVDLRKEVAIKVHHAKQEQRRATFLAKIRALPSPTAVSTPVTPPDSPAEFHFSLPSPGLVSPLALFETLSDGDGYDEEGHIIQSAWIERIDYSRSKSELLPLSPGPPVIRVPQSFANSLENHHRLAGLLPDRKPLPPLPRRTAPLALPSLDQISARIAASPSSRMTGARSTSPVKPRAGLPPFLASRTRPQSPLSPLGDAPRRGLPMPQPTVMVTPSLDVVPSSGRTAKRNEMMEKLRRRTSAPARLIPERDMHPIIRVPGGF